MNSLVCFEKVEGRTSPCVDNGVVWWHVQHGWVWNVYEIRTDTDAGIAQSPADAGRSAAQDARGRTSASVLRAALAGAAREAREAVRPTADQSPAGATRASNAPQGEALGVFFCTLLCGDGVVCHFTPRPEIRIPWYVALAAFRKGVRMLAPVCDVIYATIPAEKEKLIRVVIRLGFGIVEEGGFRRNGRTPVVLLKYYGGNVPPRNVAPASLGGLDRGPQSTWSAGR